MQDSSWLAKSGLLLVFGALVVKCISLGLQVVVSRSLATGNITGERFTNFVSSFAATSNVIVAVAVTAYAAAFLVWFHGAYRTMDDIGAAYHPPSWAVLSWLVPGINLIRPAQIMGELTNQLSAGRRPKRARWTQQLGAWWSLWVIGGAIHLVLRLYTPSTAEGWVFWEIVALVATLLLLGSLVAAWGLVDRAIRKQAGITASPPTVRRTANTGTTAPQLSENV